MFNSNALKNYYSILAEQKRPAYLALSKEELKKKVETAYELRDSCELCERKCRVKKEINLSRLCGAFSLKYSTAFPHFGEEKFFVPSYTIFFSACNFKCVFCQNWVISQKREGQNVSVEELSRIMLKANSFKNLNLVGGSPTPFLPFILDALQRVELTVPIVWNSNFYMSEKSMQLLNRVVDIYLSDWKYGNDSCAEKFSSVKNYWEIISRNHQTAFSQTDLVIRHLILPGHLECCTKKVLEEISSLFGEKVIVNLMDQFRPEYKAREYGLNRMLSREEFQEAVSLAEKLGLNFIT